ncbi:MAG: prepilin-type N-terminal cleavage/methylation domain-containing protein [Rickettsiales bacterium]|nr:prepilin-type N-terminal cleavage/methylation domain-containing protein [Rickettsiales bacterium]
MKKTFSSKKSAFSLIELSIVLIVIGLLIAGITGGASLIKSSELRSVMSEARGYAVAVNAFYSQYDALPGDYNQAVGSESTYYGNNNGNIEFAKDIDAYTAGSEGTIAWYALKQIGAIDDSLVYEEANASQIPGTNIPSSKIKSAGWIFDYFGGQNVVVLTAATTAADTDGDTADDVATAALIPSDALAVDSKIDDGISNTGKIRAQIINAASDGTCVDTDDDSYVIGGSTKTCAISYQIDVNS